MLSAVKEIGEGIIKTSAKNPLEVLIDTPTKNREYKIISIMIDPISQEFKGIDLEDFDSGKELKYLFRGVFRKGVSQGPNPSPAANINVREPQKTFEGKIKRWFGKFADREDLGSDERLLLHNVKTALENNTDLILESIRTKLKALQRREGKVLTIKIWKDNDWKYIGDFDVFKKILEAESTDTKSSKKDTTCSICGLHKSLVSGDVGVFKFYTIDKPGFITGGFNKSSAWKNFPVCRQCKLALEEGKKFIESKLSQKFANRLNYLLVPKLLVGESGVLDKILNIFADTKKVVSLKECVKKRITDDENDILEILSQEKDTVTLNFLFLQREQSAERILLLIEDILPSRIRRIFKAKDEVDSIFGKNFTFGNIREFFFKSDENKINADLDKYFLEIIDSVFKGSRLNFNFLTKFYMAKIRKEFINNGRFYLTVNCSLMDTIFFQNLGLITFEEVKDMEESIFEEVFKKYGNTFASPVRKGLFLLGSLTEMLLRKQFADRNAKPFMKKLKGLKMGERDIKALLPMVQSKLEEYDSFDKGKRIVAQEASKGLLAAGDGWKLSVDEIAFYFACGMNLVDSVAAVVYPKTHQTGKEE